MGARWRVAAAFFVFVALAGPTWAQVYEYDELDRLTRAVSNGTEVTFSYDAAGNRTAVTVPEPDGTVALVLGAMLLAMLPKSRRCDDRRHYRARTRPSGRIALGSIVLLSGALAPIRPAAADLPGHERFVPVPADAYKAYLSGASSTMAAPTAPASPALMASQPGSSTEVTPEIAELARALRHDVDLIYEYVYSQIEYNPVWGSQKGAMGALLDGTGNDFDQASLMIALLRESGYTASFVHGQQELPASDVVSWLGVPDDASVLASHMVFAGLTPCAIGPPPCSEVDENPDGTIDEARIERVWVEVEIDGTDYVFDPAFKSHTTKPGIDVGTAMGFDESSLLAGALAGATVTGDSVQSLNQANIDSALTGYAANLAAEIRANHVGATIDDIVGGRTIDPLTGFPRQTSLPYQTAVFDEWPGDIPSAFRTTLRVALPGLDETFNTDSLSGKRLTVFYEANQPVLRLDGVTIATGHAVASGSSQDLDIEVGHPHVSAAFDQAGVVEIEAGSDYVVLNDWAGTRRGTVRHHERRERELTFLGEAPLSEPVLGESLAVLAASWLAQTDEACQLSARLADARCFSFYRVGVVGQESAPTIDVPVGVSAFLSLAATPSIPSQAAFTAFLGQSAALEGGAIEQIQPSMDAVSTIALMGVANDQDVEFFDVTAANFDSISPQLQGYGFFELLVVQSYLDAGARLILPQDGNLVVDSWNGYGFLSIIGDTQVGHLIDGMKGGSGTTPGDVDVETEPEPDSEDHDQSDDPIDLVTGDFLYESTDLTVGSQPFPLGLALRKSYNSGSRHRDGPFGLGWTHNFDLRADPGSDGFQGFGEDSPVDAVAAIVGLYASAHVGTADPPGGETAAELTVAMLIQRWCMEQLTDNVVTVSEPGRTSVFVRLPDGSYSPPPGSADVLSVELDGSFLLTTKHGIEIDYDVDGRIESWQDPNGNTVDLSYSGEHLDRVDDAAGHELVFSYSGDRVSNVASGTRSFSYAYDGAGNLTTVTDANGKVTTFDYVDDGLVSEIFTPANPTNARVSNTYSTLGRVETQLDANGELWTYFIAGHRSEEVDPKGHSKIAYYDERGRTVRAIDALGFETVSEYDGEERLVFRMEPEENFSELEYDDRHNLTKVTQYPKPGSPLAPIVREFTYEPVFNRAETATDPRLHVTTYHYDTSGNLERIERPAVVGGVPETSFTYNGRGQVLTRTDPEARVTAFAYDPVTADLLTTTQDPGGLDLVTTRVYNAAGDVTSVTDPRGNTLVQTPDAMRRITQTQAPAPFDHLTRFTYDDEGNLTLLERELGSPAPWQTTMTTYTPSGKLETVTEPGTLAPSTVNQYDERDQLWRVADAKNRVTELRYDARGNLEQVIDATQVVSQEYTYTPNGEVASVRDANGNLTSYRYDGFDRLEFTDFPDLTSEQLGYDASSNRVSRTTRAGETITYTFDALDRLTSKAPSGSPSVTFVYDRSGRITETADGTGTSFFGHDAVGRRESAEDPDGRIVGYGYDEAGNRSRLTYPDGSFVTYEHDEMNRLEVVRDQGVTALATFGYDSLSRRTSVSYANGTSTSYAYEIDDDVSSIAHQLSGGAAPSFSYSYDAAHNRKSVSASDPQYVFDLLAILPTTYTPNDLNQYTTVVEDGVPHSLSYDANGNLTGPPSGHTYGFDAENRLVTATTASHTLDFEYNAFGIRTEKAVDGAGTHYVLDGSQVIAEYDDGGALLRRYVYAGLDRPIEMRTGSTSYFYHQDALGSVVALSDASGALVESHAYGPYGRVDAPSGPGIENPYLYAGRELDPETGLYYNRARYYDPVLGRFLQPDPIGFADGLNLYAYVGGNPINFVDPLGLFGEEEETNAGSLDTDVPALDPRQLDDGNIESTLLQPADLIPVALGARKLIQLRAIPLKLLLQTRLGSFLFRKGGALNSNPYIRIGIGRRGGESVFRIAIGRTGRFKLDIVSFGPIPKAGGP